MSRMKSKKDKGEICLLALFLLFCLSTFTFLLSPLSVPAQSSDQNFPTHITSNEISGVINARKLGDARLTTYYFLFEAGQGDLFINVTTTNFVGDIDVYTADSLRPLTKMVMYGAAGSSETGRLIYLRQPTRLLLRIEGRTPNDDAATYRIKFAGSFVPLPPEEYGPPPTVRKLGEPVKMEEETGTMPGTDKNIEPSASNNPSPDVESTIPETANEAEPSNLTVKPTETAPVKTARLNVKDKKPHGASQKPKTETVNTQAKPDQLASLKLIVVFKNGITVETAMTDVMRFTFDNGRLTVVKKNGAVTRYKMTDIAKITIE